MFIIFIKQSLVEDLVTTLGSSVSYELQLKLASILGRLQSLWSVDEYSPGWSVNIG